MAEMVDEVSLIESAPDSPEKPEPKISARISQEASLLGVEGLKKSYRKRTVVNDVSVLIRQGEP